MDIYATIREKSKYYEDQQQLDSKGFPIPFLVEFDMTSIFDGFIVQGNSGNGGRYMLYDVHLWKKNGGTYTTLPVHDTPYSRTFAEMYPMKKR